MAQAGSAWNDKAREEFDKKHLKCCASPRQCGNSMSNIDQILRHVIRECE